MTASAVRAAGLKGLEGGGRNAPVPPTYHWVEALLPVVDMCAHIDCQPPSQLCPSCGANPGVWPRAWSGLPVSSSVPQNGVLEPSDCPEALSRGLPSQSCAARRWLGTSPNNIMPTLRLTGATNRTSQQQQQAMHLRLGSSRLPQRCWRAAPRRLHHDGRGGEPGWRQCRSPRPRNQTAPSRPEDILEKLPRWEAHSTVRRLGMSVRTKSAGSRSDGCP